MLLDEVITSDSVNVLTAKKYLKKGAWYFKGHFPGNPIMPGHLIAEAMAQTCALLFGKMGEGEITDTYTFLSSSRTKFLDVAGPGDTLVITACPVKVISNAGVLRAEVRIQKKLVGKGEFTLALVNKKK